MLLNTETLQLLDTAFNASFSAEITGTHLSYDAVAMTVKSTNRSNAYAWLDAMPQVREWVGDRVINQLSGQTYTLTNKSYESSFSVDRDDIEDDQYDLFSNAAAGLARKSLMHRDKLIWDALANGEVALGYDGVPFFSDAHPTGDDVQSNLIAGAGAPWYVMDLNQPLKPLVFQLRKEVELVAKTALTDDNVFFAKKFIWGADARYAAGFTLWQLAVKSKATLTEANLAAARSLMLGITDSSGEVMGIMPTALVVGRSNLTAGEKLINSLTLANGESNINKGAYKLIFSPYLP